MPASMLDQITPLILTYNELPNIERALAPLAWARRIVVVEAAVPTVRSNSPPRSAGRVFVHEFVDFAGQCNFGLAQNREPVGLCRSTPIMSLSENWWTSYRRGCSGRDHRRYRAGFVYRIPRPSLRGTLYPPRTILYRRRTAASIARKGMHTGSASMAMSGRCAASSIMTTARGCRAGRRAAALCRR